MQQNQQRQLYPLNRMYNYKMSNTQQFTESMQRTLSYNDLKKRRMMRSMTNKTKLIAIQYQNKEINKQNQLLKPLPQSSTKYNQKLIKINGGLRDRSIGKQNECGKHLNILLHTDSFLNQTDQINKDKIKVFKNKFQADKNLQKIQNNSSGFKKMPSMRILTKKNSSNGLAKLNPHILKRIQGHQFLYRQKQKTIDKDQNISKYKSVPQQVLPCQPSLNQNIFFNNLSPINKKTEKRPAKQAQISGFSLLLGIQQQNEQYQYQKSGKLLKYNSNRVDCNTLFQTHLPQIETKIPRIMKKHLPKDFFLRV